MNVVYTTAYRLLRRRGFLWLLRNVDGLTGELAASCGVSPEEAREEVFRAVTAYQSDRTQAEKLLLRLLRSPDKLKAMSESGATLGWIAGGLCQMDNAKALDLLAVTAEQGRGWG